MMSAVSEGWEKYQNQGTIASGPTGTVYVAYEPGSQRHVAIKELSSAMLQQPGFLDRFRRDARVMATLESVNCVRVYEFFEDGGRAYLVQEYVNGPSLRRLIDKAGRLSPEQALGVLKGALSGLGYAHSKSLLHRDFKPENILVNREGLEKLGDFGQALAVSGTGATGGSAEGTPAYLSPEQARGGAVDYRSDVYSAGAVLFELLTGRPPFIADSPAAVIRMHLEAPVPDPRTSNPSIPDDVAFLVGKALTKDPATRQQSATEFYNELDTAAAAGYGSDWESRSSVKPLVDTAVAAAAAGAATAAVGGPAAAAPTPAAGAGPQARPVLPEPVHPLRVVVGLLLSALLILGGLGFGGSSGVLPAAAAAAAGNYFGDPAARAAAGSAADVATRQWVTISALVAGVAMLLMTIRGLFRRLRARRLAAQGKRLPGKFLVPLVLYLGVIGGLVALAGSVALAYLGHPITLPKY
jgi:serine/threonine-protein kinase